MKKMFFNLSIKGKLIVIMIFVAMLAIVIWFTLNTLMEIKTGREELLNNSVLNARFTAEYCVAPLIFDDSVSANIGLSKLETIPNILDGYVFDKNGKLFAAYHRFREKPAAVPELTGNISTGFYAGYLHVVEPIIYENQCEGTIYLRVSTSDLYKRIKNYIFFGLLILIGLMFFIFLLAHQLQKLISGPILNLVSTIRKISEESNYNIRIEKKGNDEIGVLYDDFNEMIELIQREKQGRDKVYADLQKNEQFLTNLFESVQDGVSVLNPDMSIRHVNGVMKRWYAENLPLEGKVCYQAYHNADKPCDPCPTIRCLKSGQTEYNIVPGLPGLPVEFIELFSYPVKDRDSGEITGVVEFVRDITDRKQAEEELQKHRDHLEELVKVRTKELEDKTAAITKSQEALTYLLEDVNDARKDLEVSKNELEDVNKELEAFAYSVSHDLRAPLRHIDGFAELLRSHSANQLDEKGRSYLGKILTSAQNMGTLIDDLLVFSRIGRQEILKIPVKLNPMIESIRDEFKPELKDRIVSWQIDQLGTVRADPGLIKQVFVNLLSNALKFTRPRKEVKIDVGIKKSDKGEKIIYVKDNGVGFDMKYYDKLFGVFQRLHSSSDFEGIGIGLANVQRIINRHGGRVWAESEVDKGAAFYVALPNGEGKG